MEYQLKEKFSLIQKIKLYSQQLIPLYGIVKATIDARKFKPSIIDNHHFLSGVWHGAWCVIILDELQILNRLEKLLQ